MLRRICKMAMVLNERMEGLTVLAGQRSMFERVTPWGRTHLQGLPSHHTLAIPTCGYVFMASLFGTPAAYNIAYDTKQRGKLPCSIR